MLLKNLFEEIARTGKGSTAVVGWGRGMGHKGHMMLASSVITKAKEVSGDPYFVVSRVVGKDDPLTADEKIAIYKKVFPEQGHIFQAASDDIPSLTGVLTNLNKQGYNNVTVVVGADQVNAFQYLKNYNNKPDKSGNIAFNFDNLDIISRQETNDPSAGEEGPRATPMRQVLMDPTKSEQEQFAIWRRDMPDNLSDEEVKDLMLKAKQRMAAVPASKGKKAVAEVTFKKSPYGRTAASQKRARELLNPPKPPEPKKDEKVAEDNKPNDPIVRQIQQMLNDKFGANLDIDGYLGPLTKKSIKKFLPAAKTGSAPRPEAPTAVQSISEGVDPKVSIVFDKYNPPDKDSIDGWKVAAKTKYWMVGTNKVKKDPKNPLPHEVKLACLETAMPRVKEHLEIVDDWLALAVKAYKKYDDIELVVCTRHEHIFKQIVQKNGHQGKHGYFKFDKIIKVATPYYRHDKELKKSLIDKDKTAFKRASGISPDKRVVAEHNRYEYFDLLEKFMIKRIPIVSLNESKFVPIHESIESQMENLIKRLENK